MPSTFRDRIVHRPRRTRRRTQQPVGCGRNVNAISVLGCALSCVVLVSLVGPPWFIRKLEQNVSHPFMLLDRKRQDSPAVVRKLWLKKLEMKLAKRLKASSVHSCRRFGHHGDQIAVPSRCRKQLEAGSIRSHKRRRRSIIVYNPMKYTRTWCGKTVPAKETVLISDKEALLSCKEPPRMFERKPTVEGKGMPSIDLELAWAYGLEDGDRFEDFDCNIPCRKSTYAGADIQQIYRVKGTDWTIVYSMESAQHYPELMVDEDAWRRDKFFATTSFRSDIPLPYYSWAEYNISQPPVLYDNVIRASSFMARNCESMNNREAVVEDLMKDTRVDSISECLHNADPPPVKDDGNLNGKIAVMRSYLFHLAFENSQEDDYVTEKLWGTLQSGTLPIYFGAPNVNEHAPPNSIISWHDFGSTKKLAKYMNKVAANKTLYDSYHAWRSKPLADAFHQKFDFTNTHSICRMCRWSYAKKYGLGWNHESQEVQKLVIRRDLVYGREGKIVRPFQESWLMPRDGAGYTRTVWEHDGVIDIHFESLPQSDKAVYRMKTDVEGSFRSDASNSTVFVMQNDVSRATVLTSWEAHAEFPEPGTIDITLEPSFHLSRVRLIVEDVDTFHKEANLSPNFFGDLMTRDFFFPLEAFLVEESAKHVE